MSADAIITVENLGKRYSLRHLRDQRYIALRDVLVEKATGLFRRPSAKSKANGASDPDSLPSALSPSPLAREDFWALRDISFEVRQGEVVGIIGRNGAGKSTLLKILSRITDPTEGRVRIKGRVASLLEVGTGFHPELTGRENIFLNGAVLGMSHAEIRKKFDEIVDFAETEKFLDTPVKRYSSGMYVRLAFAVAAHLEPEILVVDEVLAVGDTEFQKKCLGKMQNVAAKEGRTVLFVSHNLSAVTTLCPSAIMLSKGRLSERGRTESVIESYLQTVRSQETRPLSERFDRQGSARLRFTSVEIFDESGATVERITCGQNITFGLAYETQGDRPARNVAFSIGVYSTAGHFLLFLENEMGGVPFASVPFRGKITCEIPRFPLAPGHYEINIHVTANGIVADWIKGALQFQVVPGDFFGTGKLPPETHGGFLSEQHWKWEEANGV